MPESTQRILRALASLKLTVILMALAIFLVFYGTLVQVDRGIWTVMGQVFRTFFTRIELQTFFPRAWQVPGGFWFPGGYLIGGGLLVNLLAAHVIRFKWNRKRLGIIAIHFSLILLLLGELFTGLFALEMQMTIDEGQTVNYAQDIRDVELAVIDPSPDGHDLVTTISRWRLREGGLIQDSRLPFDVRVERYLPNASIVPIRQAPREATQVSQATHGDAVGYAAVAQPEVPGTDGREIDAPAALVTLLHQGRSLGMYLLSLHFDWCQEVVADGKTYLIGLRFRRHYKPYSLHLYEFRHDRYTGTNVPRNFSSHVRLIDPIRGEDREVLIYMNNPLRYQGETFYQSAFKNEDRTTILQVVRNPAWLLPYIACTIGGMGMIVHFGWQLIEFLRRGVR